MDTTKWKTELGGEVKARIPRKLKTKINRLARDRMVSTSDILRAALDEFVKRNEAAA